MPDYDIGNGSLSDTESNETCSDTEVQDDARAAAEEQAEREELRKFIYNLQSLWIQYAQSTPSQLQAQLAELYPRGHSTGHLWFGLAQVVRFLCYDEDLAAVDPAVVVVAAACAALTLADCDVMSAFDCIVHAVRILEVPYYVNLDRQQCQKVWNILRSQVAVVEQTAPDFFVHSARYTPQISRRIDYLKTMETCPAVATADVLFTTASPETPFTPQAGIIVPDSLSIQLSVLELT
ncbi:hypothetical protein FB45DRAFT_1057714 [Roridomyces roridus]|uniref:Uncharacterized protein n=1 Tax=Roridomyces roridus TaxID=1738132 RepID=A0AAD7BWV1_9AGAR|nr:hypothetical protein FB45DRAFT_1057714 [Roridomyces roridus]